MSFVCRKCNQVVFIKGLNKPLPIELQICYNCEKKEKKENDKIVP